VVARTEQLRKAIVDLERSYDITLEALGDALDKKRRRDRRPFQTSDRIHYRDRSRYGAVEGSIAIIARGAFLHDIGKMAVPDAILRKPGKLTLTKS